MLDDVRRLRGDLAAPARAPRARSWPARDDLVDQADARRPSRPRSMSPVSSISIACLRDTLRDSATIGVEQNSPMLTPGVAKLAVARGDREIAARDELAAGRRRDALHRGDHRLRQGDDLLHHGAAGVHDLLEIGAAAVGIAAPAGQLLEVVAGAERRAVGGEHDGAHAAYRARSRSSASPSAREHRLGQAVARRRPVERQHRDAGRVLAQQDRRRRAVLCGRLGCSCSTFAAAFALRTRALYPIYAAAASRGQGECEGRMAKRQDSRRTERRGARALSGGRIPADVPRRRAGFRSRRSGTAAAACGRPIRRNSSRPGGTISGPTMMALADFAMYVGDPGLDRPGAARGHHQSQHQFPAQAGARAT